jgi:hypothetical protein
MSNLIVACVGDTHVCPLRGHGSSPIMANGATASVDGIPIARVGDACGCGAVIVQGYPPALLDGRPLAHMGALPPTVARSSPANLVSWHRYGRARNSRKD